MSGRVVKNSAYYVLAALLPSGLSLFTLPLYSASLSPDDYGILALIQTFTIILPLLLTFQLHTSIGRYWFEFDGEARRAYLSSLLCLVSGTAVLGLAALLHFLPHLLSAAFPSVPEAHYPLFRTSVWVTFLNVFVYLFTSLSTVQEQAKRVMITSVSLLAFSTAITMVELLVLKRGLEGFVEATLWASALGVLAYGVPVLGAFWERPDFRLLKGPVLYSLPVIPHTLSAYVFMFSDRFILERYVALAAIGLYSFSDKIAFLFRTLVHKFSEAYSPYFMGTAKRDPAAAVREAALASGRVNYGLCLLIALASLSSYEIMLALFDERYLGAWTMIPLLATSYIFRSLYQFSSLGLFYEKRTGRIAVITFVSGALNILVNLALIPRFGVMVAVWSTIASFLCSAVMAEVLSSRKHRVRVLTRGPALVILHTFAVIGAAWFINTRMDFGSPGILAWYALKVLLFVSLLWSGKALGVYDLLSLRTAAAARMPGALGARLRQAR